MAAVLIDTQPVIYLRLKNFFSSSIVPRGRDKIQIGLIRQVIIRKSILENHIISGHELNLSILHYNPIRNIADKVAHGDTGEEVIALIP